MHWSRGPTSCVGRKATSPPLRGRGGGDLAGVGARGMRAGGFPGNPGGLIVSILKVAGGRAPAHQARGRGRGTWRPTERTRAGARMVPPREGNEARGDGRRGIGAPHTTGEAGESCPRNPVEGRGRREMDPLAGKTANTPRLEPVSTLRQRIAERARHALGMAWVIFIASWTNGYATARSEAICRGAGCGRTRTSGSVGGQGQQRPWSTRPVFSIRSRRPARATSPSGLARVSRWGAP